VSGKKRSEVVLGLAWGRVVGKTQGGCEPSAVGSGGGRGVVAADLAQRRGRRWRGGETMSLLFGE
jgi:hypothetical protein